MQPGNGLEPIINVTKCGTPNNYISCVIYLALGSSYFNVAFQNI